MKKNNIKETRSKARRAFGIVNPWPGSMSAEFEVLSRIKKASDDNGIDCVMLSNFGHILDEKQKMTEEFVNSKDLDFVITTHYDSHKTVDSFHYHTLWNPPEIPLNLGDYHTRVTDNYIMNDDFLIYDSGGMSDHLKCILMNSQRNIEGASTLVASFPQSAILKPKLDNIKMFYCGMNWERIVHNSNRHEGLFKMLDKTNEIKFFGPDKNPDWGGIAPWEGYKCYQYPIPFDGFSILKEINDCGVVLVLSSDIHRRAGAATNRTYEACAGGAVIISDDNQFMEEHFKDAALFIKYNKLDPEDTYKQIMEKYEWIKKNPEKALKLAQRAQEIFLEKFTLDKQLSNIFDNHESRFQAVKDTLFAKSEDTVLVTAIASTKDDKEAIEYIDTVIQNIKNQYYKNIRLAVACDCSLEKLLDKHYKKKNTKIDIVPVELFDIKGARLVNEGEAIRKLSNMFEHKYIINTFSNEVWFKDHITTLVRTIEENPEIGIAFSGRNHEDIYGYRRTDMFRGINYNQVLEGRSLPCAGQIMLSYNAEQKIPDYFIKYIDGLEHYAYVALSKLKFGQDPIFTKRMTLLYTNKNKDKVYNGFSVEYQLRLIRDAVKENLNSSVIMQDYDNKDLLKAFPLVEIPAKKWFILKFYRFRLSRTNVNSKKYVKIRNKFEQMEAELMNTWREICTRL